MGGPMTRELLPSAITPLKREQTALVELIAERMQATLVEVLGEERGASMYSMDWLRQRVLEHLDREDAAVFVAVDVDLLGHTIVREEPWSGGVLGLFSTIHVAPAARRRGVADALFDRGEAWMRERGLARAATHTAAHNTPLHRLCERRGYTIDLRDGEMVRLARDL